MNLKQHFDEERWQAVRQNWTAWWAGELERPLVVLKCVAPQDRDTPHYAGAFLGNWPLEMPVDDLLDLFTPRLEAIHYLGDSFPRFWPNYGPGITSAFAGAQVHPMPNTTWFSPGQAGPLSDLHVACQEHNPWWQRVQEITQAAVQRWGDQLLVGHTDLGGNLDILAGLHGTQQLLVDLCTAPAEVDRLVGEITRLWLNCYDALCTIVEPAGYGTACWAPLWFPGRGYMLQSDFAYMISPAMFERFVLPDIQACCQAMDYAFYHLDGKGQIRHLDLLLSLPRLRGIQWVPGDGQLGAEHWLPLLKRIREAGKLCQVPVSARGALDIQRQLGGKGFVLLIEETLTPQEGEDFMHLIGGWFSSAGAKQSS
jgi:hypothetical protein